VFITLAVTTVIAAICARSSSAFTGDTPMPSSFSTFAGPASMRVRSAASSFLAAASSAGRGERRTARRHSIVIWASSSSEDCSTRSESLR
jgi:hypothetical protein